MSLYRDPDPLVPTQVTIEHIEIHWGYSCPLTSSVSHFIQMRMTYGHHIARSGDRKIFTGEISPLLPNCFTSGMIPIQLKMIYIIEVVFLRFL